MPSSSTQQSRPRIPSPPPPVRWRVWYLAEHPAWAIGWFLFLVGVWMVVVWVTGRGYLGWLAVGVGLLASWRLWIPIRYELGPEGIQEKIWTMRSLIPWEEIGRYEQTSSGVWLFPKHSLGPGEAGRGFYLPWAAHRQQVLRHLQHYLETISQPPLNETKSSDAPTG